MLEILYQDQYLVAINKPHNLLVHASPIARNAEEFALQLLRNQINKKVFPLHRLDRKTSGVLLFALDKKTNQLLTKQFTNHEVVKKYWAIVRGFTPVEQFIDYPLKKDNGAIQSAQTHIKTIKHIEIPLAYGKHLSSRYSLIEAEPKTGRMHQIRKHLAHIFHPIIADRPHGCNKQNKLWLETFKFNAMLLHAKSLSFTHPYNKQKILIEAPLSREFIQAFEILNIKK